MGRIGTKAPHRRKISASAAPSRGQRKRALKKATLVRKKSLARVAERFESPPDDAQEGGGSAAAGPHLGGASGGDALSTQSSTSVRAEHPTRHQTIPGQVMNNKSKKTLVASELSQLESVLATASFQQDPFAAVQAHLRETARAVPPPASGEKQKTRKGAKTVASRGTSSGSALSQKMGGAKKVTGKPYKGRNAKMRVKR